MQHEPERMRTMHRQLDRVFRGLGGAEKNSLNRIIDMKSRLQEDRVDFPKGVQMNRSLVELFRNADAGALSLEVMVL